MTMTLSEPDVERLKYILELQRDHFMPLRVIKERLAEADPLNARTAVAYMEALGLATGQAEALHQLGNSEAAVPV